MILNGTQNALVAQLMPAKEVADHEREQAKIEADLRIGIAKSRLADVVAKCMEAGVPQRQIHLALGYTREASLTSFLGVDKLKSLLTDTVRTSNPLTVADIVPDIGKHKVEFTDTQGRDWKIDWLYTPSTKSYFIPIHDTTPWIEEEEVWEILKSIPRTVLGVEQNDALREGTEPDHWTKE